MALRMHSGRRSSIDPASLVPPDSALARDAVVAAQDLLTPALLNHSSRAFTWSAAIAALHGITFDRELLRIDDAALRRALQRDRVVNPGYQNYITAYAPVTRLEPDAVREVSAALAAEPMTRVSWDALAMTESQARAALDLTD